MKMLLYVNDLCITKWEKQSQAIHKWYLQIWVPKKPILPSHTVFTEQITLAPVVLLTGSALQDSGDIASLFSKCSVRELHSQPILHFSAYLMRFRKSEVCHRGRQAGWYNHRPDTTGDGRHVDMKP